MIVRVAVAADAAFLADMLVEAAYWRPADPANAVERRREADGLRSLDRLLEDPSLARYLADWPLRGDLGVVAEEASAPIGAAWWRHFTSDHHGYGFVDETIPEITIGVRPDARGRGVGTALLRALADHGRRREVPALSLSVEPDNPALRLYERQGFVVVGRDGGALTMVRTLTD
jgi:ribosomal protein S18 acetylase RimI-like enzyme